MEKLKIELHAARNFTRDQRIKLYRALRLCVKTINHPLFKQEVENFRWYDKKNKVWKDIYHMSEGLTRKQVYELFMSGKDIYNKKIDYDMDVDITAYYEDSTVIGYTYGNSMRTWINMKFFNQWGISNICSNIVHEALHNVGFNHEYNWTYERQFSVPYAIGYIAGDIAKHIEKGRI